MNPSEILVPGDTNDRHSRRRVAPLRTLLIPPGYIRVKAHTYSQAPLRWETPHCGVRPTNRQQEPVTRLTALEPTLDLQSLPSVGRGELLGQEMRKGQYVCRSVASHTHFIPHRVFLYLTVGQQRVTGCRDYYHVWAGWTRELPVERKS